MKEPLVNFTQMSGGGSGDCESVWFRERKNIRCVCERDN